MTLRPRILPFIALALATSALADTTVRVFNLMTGTNKGISASRRISKADVTGGDVCRVSYQQNGDTLELFPLKNGKTKVWLYDMEGKVFEEIRINVCTKAISDLYDQYAAQYKSVEGLVVDIDANRLSFSGTIFSMAAYRELTELAPQRGWSVEGLQLHPYVTAILQEPTTAMGPVFTATPAPASP